MSSGEVNKPVTNAAKSKEITACSFKTMMQNKTTAVPITKIKIGSMIFLSSPDYLFNTE
jgi:hypothetical protein